MDDTETVILQTETEYFDVPDKLLTETEQITAVEDYSQPEEEAQ